MSHDRGRYRAVLLWIKTYSYLVAIVTPFFIIAFCAVLFTLLNQFNLRWISWILIAWLVLALMYRILPLPPARSIVRWACRSIGAATEESRNNDTPNRFKIWKGSFAVGMLSGMMSAMTIPGLLKPSKVFRRVSFKNHLGVILFLLIAVFYVRNPQIHFSFAHVYDFSKMILLSTINIFTAGFSSVLGFTYKLTIPLQRFDQIMIGLIEVLTVSIVAVSLFKELYRMLKGQVYISGNYSEVLEFLKKVKADQAPTGFWVVYDYGFIDELHTPQRWYYDDVKRLAEEELYWLLENCERLLADELMRNDPNQALKLVRRLNQDDIKAAKENPQTDMLDLNLEFSYYRDGVLQIEFSDSKEIMAFSHLRIEPESRLIYIVTNAGQILMLKYQAIWPLTSYFSQLARVCLVAYNENNDKVQNEISFDFVKS